jgi:hypothetical protein
MPPMGGLMRRRVGIGLAIFSLAIADRAEATSWVYSDDFAVVLPQTGQGAGSAWWYSHADPADMDGDYPLFTTGNGSAYTFAPNAFHLVGPNYLHPGTFNFGNPASNPEPDCVIEFRAPATEIYRVRGTFTDNDGSDFDGPTNGRGIRFMISTSTAPGTIDRPLAVLGSTTATASVAYMDGSNTNEWMRTELGGVSPLPTRATFDFVIRLVAGQMLYFRVNDLASNRFDSTGVEITIDDGAMLPVPDAGFAEDATLPDAAEVPDAGTVEDATSPEDARPVVDSGEIAEVGPEPEAGVRPDATERRDAAPLPDATVRVDAGSGRDAGLETPESGCECGAGASHGTGSAAFAGVAIAIVFAVRRKKR